MQFVTNPVQSVYKYLIIERIKLRINSHVQVSHNTFLFTMLSAETEL